ncbi:MAG: YchJ family protein [Pseudomonadota bacterium]
MSQCPCCSGIKFSDCCAPYLKGKKKPETALALIRSRYTAHTFANIDYIQSTHHPSHRHEIDVKSTREWAENSEWLALDILDTTGGTEDDDQGTVEFIAKFNDASGKLINHHELSLFAKHEGEWFFVDAEAPKVQQFRREAPKVGRNDPCSCGSGKKYKKCCGKAA